MLPLLLLRQQARHQVSFPATTKGSYSMSAYLIRSIVLNVLDLYQKIPAGTLPGVSGKYLMGRDVVGIPIRRLVEDKLTQVSGPTTCILNFFEIQDISASVAEELGPMLTSFVSARSHPNTEIYLVYANLSADVRLGLDDEFKRRGHVAIAVKLDQPEQANVLSSIDLLGPSLPAPLQEVVSHCYTYGEATSTGLASDSLAAASKKLTEVFEKYPHLLYRVKVTGASGPRSWQYVYYSVIPPNAISLKAGASNG
jgi:hypothetical protein